MIKINYENVTTSEDLKQISTEEYQNAVNLGILEYKKTYKPDSNHFSLTRTQFKKGYGLTVIDKEMAAGDIYTRKHSELSDTERMIVACEFLLPTDSFVRTLVNKGYDYVELFSYVRLIRGLKKIMLEAKEEHIDSSVVIANLKLEKICKIMQQYYGVKNYDYILSKLCQVVWFEKQLFDQLKKSEKRLFVK